MRFCRYPIWIIAVSLLLTTVAYAHPGRTDSDGGHTNHSTGEYHYHHGYDDHQHYDMDGDGDIDCPYEFKDRTGSNSSYSSKGSTGKVSSKYPQQSKKSSDLGAKISFSLCILFFFGWFISAPILWFLSFILSRFKRFSTSEAKDKLYDKFSIIIHFIVCAIIIYFIIIR